MSTPSEPDDVKLIASLISKEEKSLELALADLVGLFGPVDWKSPLLPFDRTRYYEREMGGPLLRVFVSFERLIMPDALVEVKLATNRLEDMLRRNGLRTVNIDPGYICLERLVLSTGKNYTHRIYLHRGVFADLTLVYHKQSFRPLPWTYPDYADVVAIELFNRLRDRYKAGLRGLPMADFTENLC